jgi:hypothetical protein
MPCPSTLAFGQFHQDCLIRPEENIQDNLIQTELFFLLEQYQIVSKKQRGSQVTDISVSR